MELHVKGKNLQVSDAIRSYAERKLSKLDKQVSKLEPASSSSLQSRRTPPSPTNQVAEATVWLKGHTLRAREATRDMKASIDELTEKLLRQVKDERERKASKRKIDKHALDADDAATPLFEPLPAQGVAARAARREGGLVERRNPERLRRGARSGIHGMQRAREWDVTQTVEAPGIEGDACRFVALPDGAAARRGGRRLVAPSARRRDRARAAAAVPRAGGPSARRPVGSAGAADRSGRLRTRRTATRST